MLDYRSRCACSKPMIFFEGVRAAILDKDHAPRWQCASIDEVTEAMVEGYFEPLSSRDIGPDLALPVREEMGQG